MKNETDPAPSAKKDELSIELENADRNTLIEMHHAAFGVTFSAFLARNVEDLEGKLRTAIASGQALTDQSLNIQIPYEADS